MSAAAAFADAAEELGWIVKRERTPEGGRLVIAERGNERVELRWKRNERGNIVYDCGRRDDEPITNVKAALRDMAKIRTANGALLPFDPINDDAGTILAAVAGRKIVWTNSISGLDEEGDLPRGGMHLRISEERHGRVLYFADQVHTGFRAVRLTSIKDVK